MSSAVPISRRCRICDAHDQPLEENGGFRKRCVDRGACAKRAEQRRRGGPRAACVYCQAEDQPLAGDGPRKRCVDEKACASRVRGDGELVLNALERGRGKRVAAAASVATTRAPRNDMSAAEAMIEILQERASMDAWDGPVSLGQDIQLPLCALQNRNIILGKTGSGKTNALAVIGENCIENHVPLLAIDYLGNFTGWRIAGDSDGLPIPIIGGPSGDMPLQLSDATVLAQIFAEGTHMLLDLSDYGLDEQQYFTADLFNELFRALRRPAHVLMDEAETGCPAFSRSKAQFASQGAVLRFARQIRRWGVGWSFASQEPTLVHPTLFNSANVFFAMQSTGDATQRAIGKDAGTRIGKPVASVILSELGQLNSGEAWLIPDASWIGDKTGAPVRFRFRKRYTWDSTSVPKIGEMPKTPPPMVKADLRPFARLHVDELERRRGKRTA